jgi:hypothetical protein
LQGKSLIVYVLQAALNTESPTRCLESTYPEDINTGLAHYFEKVVELLDKEMRVLLL